MRNRKPIMQKVVSKVCHVTKDGIERLEIKKSNYARRIEILKELGEDLIESEKEMKIIALNRMSKLNLI